MAKVQVLSDGTSTGSRVLVDGVELEVTKIDVHIGLDSIPLVTVTMYADSVDITLDTELSAHRAVCEPRIGTTCSTLGCMRFSTNPLSIPPRRGI